MRVDWDFFALIALALLVSPPEVTAAVLVAAAMHEGGHAAMLRFFGVPMEGLRLDAMGAVIVAPGARRLSYGRELAVTMAGIAVNLISAPLLARLAVERSWEWGYLLAGAHLLLGAYNLLPVPPLDGGRALYLVTAYFWGPDAGEKISASVGLTVALLLALFGASVTFSGGGVLFLIAALGLLFELICSRRVCLRCC